MTTYPAQNPDNILISLIFLAMVLCAYFAPAIVAWCNHKRNSTAVFALNLLLGWTFIGWVVALVWALTKDSEPVHA